MPASPSISVVTPTLRRPREVKELLENLSLQTLLPRELVLVDGAPLGEDGAQAVVEANQSTLPFRLHYIRGGGGTAIQRNIGIGAAQGEFIAFVDDDIRLDANFLEQAVSVFQQDVHVGGVTGYITNQYLDPNTSKRWQWYRRLKLFTIYEPGRYDYQSGYPINRYLQSPHDGIKEIDFMGAGCAVWRAQVFAGGLRFDEFFTGFGVLEDAHLALRAGKQWKLVENGRARCVHLHSQGGREDLRKVMRKTAVNYRYVFVDIVPERSFMQEFRFWRLQAIDLANGVILAVLHPSRLNFGAVVGKVEGLFAAARIH